MSDVRLFAWIVMGVVISVVLPIFIKWLKEFSDRESKGGFLQMATRLRRGYFVNRENFVHKLATLGKRTLTLTIVSY